MSYRRSRDRHRWYEVRLMACLVVTLSLLIGAVRLWPATDAQATEEIVYAREGPIIVKGATPTRQQQAALPPPPLPPVPVPNDVELEEQTLDFSRLSFPADALSEGPPAREGTAGPSASAPVSAVAARQITIVEPEYTAAARHEHIRAHVVVEVLVGTDGRVKEARIVKCLLLDEHNEPKAQVAHLGYGLEASALKAAQRTLFLPAQSGGRPVKSRKTIVIRFGL